MKSDNRVLSRKGARELTPAEAEVVVGAISTQTLCSIGPNNSRDGDVSLGECGPA
jgi:hypothetical protein